MIRPARPDDAEALRAIEVAGGARFAEIGMHEVAEDEPMTAGQLIAYSRAGRSWVSTDRDDHPTGYVLVDLIDGFAHVEQVTVHPDHQRQGLARALLDEVERWAAERGVPALTLTTFRHVAWNQPLYEHLGFRALTGDELTPGLRAILAAEARHGLDPRQRVCMRRDLRPQPPRRCCDDQGPCPWEEGVGGNGLEG